MGLFLLILLIIFVISMFYRAGRGWLNMWPDYRKKYYKIDDADSTNIINGKHKCLYKTWNKMGNLQPWKPGLIYIENGSLIIVPEKGDAISLDLAEIARVRSVSTGKVEIYSKTHQWGPLATLGIYFGTSLQGTMYVQSPQSWTKTQVANEVRDADKKAIVFKDLLARLITKKIAPSAK